MSPRIKNYVGRNYKKRRRKDNLSTKQRSNLMSRIRSKNTGLEKSFFRLLRKSTRIKFRTHVTSIRGKPDVVFPKQRVCVFIDGDFWHGWQFPRWKHQMKNEFWRLKIEKNRKRDRRIYSFLRRKGWIVLRFWEHEINNDKSPLIILTRALKGNRFGQK